MQLLFIFLTGLTAGGLSCLALQAGLFTGVVTRESNASKNSVIYAAVAFILTRLAAHTILGLVLGFVGSAVSLSLPLRLFFQSLAGFFMLATAGNMLQLHPYFRYFALRPPKTIYKKIRGLNSSKALVAPALLGAATIFVPCGVTQAMEILAITTADPIQAALIMFSFTAGTSVLFMGLGMVANALSQSKQALFTRIVAIFLIGMGLYALNGVFVVMNAPFTLNTIVRPITYFFSDERFAGKQLTPTTEGVQRVTISVTNSGYSPRTVTVRKGVPVELILESSETYSCAVAFVFAEFDIDVFLKPTDRQSFIFTPTQTGRFPFSCSMGMYTGEFVVVE